MEKIIYEPIAQLLAGALMADGYIIQQELDYCKAVAEDLNIDGDSFVKIINNEGQNLAKMNDEQFDAYLTEVAQSVDPNYRNVAFEIVINGIMSDKVLTTSECDVFAAIAEKLQINLVDAFASFACIIGDTPDLIIGISDE